MNIIPGDVVEIGSDGVSLGEYIVVEHNRRTGEIFLDREVAPGVIPGCEVRVVKQQSTIHQSFVKEQHHGT